MPHYTITQDAGVFDAQALRKLLGGNWGVTQKDISVSYADNLSH
ncbi:MAG: hypothetical protein ACJ0HH_02050 [Candidatus Thalassarchaeum sp.]